MLTACSSTCRARGVQRSRSRGIAEYRLWAAWRDTPSDSLISAHVWPAARHASTKWPTSASPASASSPATADAVASRARGASLAASAVTVAIRSLRSGAGAICQLVVDSSRICQPGIDSAFGHRTRLYRGAMPAQQTADGPRHPIDERRCTTPLQKVSGGRLGRTVFGMKAVQLHTTGRKSGQRRTVWLTSPVHDDRAHRAHRLEGRRRPAPGLVPQRRRRPRRRDHRRRRHHAVHGPARPRRRRRPSCGRRWSPPTRATPATRSAPSATSPW